MLFTLDSLFLALFLIPWVLLRLLWTGYAKRLWWETLFLFYLLHLIELTLLPSYISYSTASVSSESAFIPPFNVVPLLSIISLLNSGEFYTAHVLHQLGGNLILLFPFGLLLPLLVSRPISGKRAVWLGLGIAISIEVLQLWTYLFDHFGNRVFDVDDILLNYLGFVLGYASYRLALGSIHRIREKNKPHFTSKSTT